MKIKRITALVCAFALAAAGAAGVPAVKDIFGIDTAISASAAAEKTSSDGKFGYSFRDDGTITVDRVFALDVNLTIPAKIDGYKVSMVGFEPSNATYSGIFNYIRYDGKATPNGIVKTVHIAEGIETIGQETFCQSDALEKIYFPSTLKRIEKGALGFCADSTYKLTDVYFEKGDVQIDRMFFNGYKDTIGRIINFHVYKNSGAEKYALEFNQNNSGSKINIIYREDEVILGDIDGSGGEPDVDDLVLMQKAVAGWRIDENYKKAADIDKDGDVDVDDLILLQKKVAGWKVEFVKKSQ